MRDFGTEIAPGTIRFQRYMPGPIPRIWDYLTHPTIRGRWLATGPMDLRDGGKFEMTFHHDELTPHAEIAPDKFASPKGFTVRGEVLQCKFPNLISLTWPTFGPESAVSFVLNQMQGQVGITLTHSGLPDRDTLIEVAAGWHAHLNILEAKSNSVLPPPYWKRFSQYLEEYRTRLAAS
jgi:uncharacterized protein YndB with AHSA1/START domain